ncbi:COX2 oxidase, partial [Piaya cayana]|nr:COX2 oxidase [Piaya cayana]
VANHSPFGFQDESSAITEKLAEFHGHALIITLANCSLVLYQLALILIEKLSSNFTNAQEVELI